MSSLILWLAATWAAGRLLLPLSRHLFPRLPDGGLAAGRVLWLTIAALLALWTAVYHIAPLSFAPLWIFGLPLLGLIPLRKREARETFKAWLRGRHHALQWSDAVFIGSFLLFAIVRARHPEINDLEKPMDAALMASAARSAYLPFTNPWFAGQSFTDYYYSFHLVGGLLLRSFGTPVAVGYNLVHPLICALFLSTLWSLCAALSGTFRRGLACISMVALLGHYEPIREWRTLYLKNADQLFHLDWWHTSRVIFPENTINEYPAFTIAIGDAHAHFLAFPFAALLFCLTYELVAAPLGGDSRRFTRRRALLLLSGALLALFWTGNTWDVPVYSLLVLTCALWPLLRLRALYADTGDEEAEDEETADDSEVIEDEVAEEDEPVAPAGIGAMTRRERRRLEREAGITRPYTAAYLADPPVPSPASALAPSPVGQLEDFLPRLEWAWVFVPLLLARVLAQPYLKTFVPQVSGVRVDPWLPPLMDVLMFWYGTFALLGFCWLFWLLKPRVRAWAITAAAPSGMFSFALFSCGAVAWVIPWLLYVRGAWGDGDLRHQDTVFKFGLQAWLMLNTAGACGAARLMGRLTSWKRPIVVGIWAAMCLIPLMCSLNVFWTRTTRDAPHDGEGRIALSLNGGRNLTDDDQDAIEWLRRNAPPDAVVVEACNPNVTMTGDFEGDLGRVSALSGVPTVYGWGQHVTAWGGDGEETTRRHQDVIRIYQCTSAPAALQLLRKLKATYVFVGGVERSRFDPAGIDRLDHALPDKVFQQGQTFIARVP